ncbi:hypothetical protein GCM10027046_27310 [Uliginosibacterium flavum]|uniref:AraC family transcriptional regulator n=1 Tax=Uliginosibacterium flavum TaxID=1396831 RepID=A0ABV2TMA5_9RHOO
MSIVFSVTGRETHKLLTVPLGWRHDQGSEVALVECDCFAIGLIRAGSVVLAFDDKVVPVAAPAIFILDERTRPVLRNAHALQVSTLYFNPAYINDALQPCVLHDEAARRALAGSTKQDYFLLEPFIKQSGARGVFPLPAHLAGQVASLLDAIITQAGEQPDKYWPCRGRSFLIELLFQLRLLQGDAAPALALPVMPEDARTSRIERALSYVQERYQQEFTLGDLARSCATNRTTLNSEFRAATGMTVRAYTIALRMKMAAALLRDTKIPVAEVMTRVGYGNQSHFTRAFHQSIGDTPRAYREKNIIF